jgi:hypothetical protein
MGNSNNAPNTDTLSLSSSAPLWSRIMRDVSRGMPIATWKQPSGIVTATVDAVSGMKPGPFTTKTIKELFIKGTQPTETDDLRRTVDIDSATGDLWQAGCLGPEKTVGALDFSNVEASYGSWNRADRLWARRAARGPGVGGGPKGSRTSYFYGTGFFPFGRSWGGIFAPTKLCQPPVATPPPCDPLLGLPCPSLPPGPGGGGGGKSPKPHP